MPSFLNFFFFPFFKGGGLAGKEGEASPPHPTPHPAYPLTKASVLHSDRLYHTFSFSWCLQHMSSRQVKTPRSYNAGFADVTAKIQMQR